MKKRLLSLVMAIAMICGFMVYLPTLEVKAFSPRTSAPSTSESYFYASNPFYQCGYGMPNCTAYAYGRAWELLGSKPNLSTGNANTWYDYNINHGVYSYGITPKLGAIACWTTTQWGPGHVAVVEAINGNKVTISESSWGGFNFRTKEMNSNGSDYMGSSFQGYIYILGDNPQPHSAEPKGCLDSVVGGTGEITVSGWAFDPDVPNESIDVHVYIGGPAGTSGAERIIINANKYRDDVNRAYGIGGNHGFSATIPTSKSGNQSVYVYGINNDGTGFNPEIWESGKTVTINTDTVNPIVSNIAFEYHNMGSLGFVVIAKATDNIGVEKAEFAVWTLDNGQDDLIWYKGTAEANNYYWAFIPTSEHNNELGKYIIHFYAWDKADNHSYIGIDIDLQQITLPHVDYKTIKEGTYSLKSGTGYYMDNAAGRDEDLNPLISYNFNGTAAQRFRFEYQGNGNYLIYPECANNKAISVHKAYNGNDSIDPGDSLMIKTPDYLPTKLYKVVPLENGKYALVLAENTNYVIGGRHNFNGTPLFIQTYTNHSISCEWEFCDPETGERVEPCAHQYTSSVTKSATCAATGIRTYTCMCGDSYTEIIPKLTTHTFGNWSTTKAATCAAEGTQSRKCTVCGKTETKSIAKTTTHSYTSKVIAPTTTAQGYTLHTCSVCGNSYKDNYTDKVHTHNYISQVTRTATCAATGVRTYTCSCGDSYTETIPKLTTHTFGNWTTTKAATCAAEGTQTRKCTVCGKTETKSIAKTTTHSYTSKVIAPTTTAQGYTLHTCSICGNSYKDNYTDKLAVHTHSYTSKVTKSATCAATGIRTYTCSCGDSYTEIIPTAEHKYTAKTVAPTYTAQGYTQHTCSVCGKSYKDSYKAKHTRTSIAKATVSGISAKTYTGKAIAQTPVVKLGTKALKKGTDYTISYKNNKAVGKATVTITGKGAYTGTVTKTFKINPKATSISKLTSPKTKQLKATFKKVSGVTGYQVTYSTSKKFTKSTTKTVSVKTTNKTVKSLKKGKTYYVKVRTYKTVGGVKYYSAYSTVKRFKIK